MKARLLIIFLTAIPKRFLLVVLMLSVAGCDGQGSTSSTQQTGDTTIAQIDRNVGLVCVHDDEEPTKFIKVNIAGDQAEQFDFAYDRWESWDFSVRAEYIGVDQYSNSSIYLHINRTSLRGVISYIDQPHDWGCSLKSWDEVDQMVKEELDKLNQTRAF